MATWATIPIDTDLVRGYEPDEMRALDLAGDPSTLEAVRRSLKDRLRSYLSSVVDAEGVTETVFFNELADMSATSDARALLANMLAVEHLYWFYRGQADRTGRGEHDAKRRDLYSADAKRLASDYAAVVKRAIAQDEITFTSGEVTRTTGPDPGEIVWVM